MIWIILTFLGTPLWFCGVALGILLRGRHRVKHLPGGFGCKVRVASRPVPGLKPEFSRITGVGHWIHAVLVLHGGNPFLARTGLCGIQTVESGPSDIDPAAAKRIDDPVAVRSRHDNGATLELACARDDLEAMLGPFGQQRWTADAPAHRPPPSKAAS